MGSAAIEQNYGTGRRKTCTARVFLRKGSGKIIINGQELEKYFGRPTAVMVVKQPLKVVDVEGQFDIFATVAGGGVMGQAGALRLGVTRALMQYDEIDDTRTSDEKSSAVVSIGDESSDTVVTFRRKLRKAGYVTRDSRKVERKKVGFRKARKREQYSKR